MNIHMYYLQVLHSGLKFSKIVQYISFIFSKVVSFHLMNSHISEDWVKKLSLISNPKYLPCFRTISKLHLISIFMVWIMYVINHDYDLMTKALFWCSARIVYIYHCAPKNVKKVHDKINVLKFFPEILLCCHKLLIINK